MRMRTELRSGKAGGALAAARQPSGSLLLPLMAPPAGRRAGFIPYVMSVVLMIIFAAVYVSYDTQGFSIAKFSIANTMDSTQLGSQAVTLKTGVQTMVAKGWAPCEITWNTTRTAGNWMSSDIFNPTGGGEITAPLQLNNVNVGDDMAAPGVASQWHYHCGIRIADIGEQDYPELIGVYPNLKLGVCQKINENVYKDDARAAPPVASGSMSLSNWVNGNSETPLLADGNGVAGRPFGCVQSADGYYLYYHVFANQ